MESYFVKANSPDGERALWIRFTIFSPNDGKRPGIAETWCIAFQRGVGVFGAKQPKRLDLTSLRSHPFSLDFGKNHFAARAVRGIVESETGTFAWDFTLDPIYSKSFRPLPFPSMYDGAFPRTKSLTTTPSARLRGTAQINGEAWNLDGWNATQGHNWGVSHAHRWSWTHCADFPESPGTWFEAITGRVRVGLVTSPTMASAGLFHNGKLYRFDSLGTLLLSNTRTSLFSHEFAFASGECAVRGKVSAARKDIACVLYENPDGSLRSCLNSKLAEIELTIEVERGAPIVLTSNRATLELGMLPTEHDLPTLV